MTRALRLSILTTLAAVTAPSFAQPASKPPNSATRLVMVGTAGGPAPRPSPANVGVLASKAGVQTVILSHLSPRPDGDDYTPWAEEVRKNFSGQVIIAKDLMEF